MKLRLTIGKWDTISYIWHLYVKVLYQTKQYSLLLFCSAAFSLNTMSQTTVSGTVKDRQGEPLPGVSIKVKDTSTGVSTDANGKYSINLPNTTGTLVFSLIGFKNQEIAVSGKTEINATLEEDVTNLNEVVVVGYGSQSRATVTNSISKLDTKVLENVPYANVASAMQGNVSGVRVQSLSGQPGSGPRILIRGGTSINNPNRATPLYIVDGILRNDLNDINSDDVESLQVLKDAAATAIYGARGSNGVVIVTTKSGKAGRTQISYSYDITSSEQVDRLDVASARDFIYYGRLGLVESVARGGGVAATSRLSLSNNSLGTGNDLTKNTSMTTQYLTPANQYKLNEGWESMTDPADPTKTIIFKETDFQDVLFQRGISHNHNLTLNGGTEKATFNIGLGAMLGEGTVITTKYNRLSANVNGQFKVRNNLNVFGRVLYSNSKKNLPYGTPTSPSTANDIFINQTNEIFYRSLSMPKAAKYTFEDGTLAPGQSRTIGNPAYFMPLRDDESTLENLTIALGTNWKILPDLSFDPQLSLYRINDNSRSFIPAYQNGAGPGNFISSRPATTSASIYTQYQADGVLTYIKTLKDVHNVEAKLGVSYVGRKNSSFSANGQGAATDLIPTLNASSTFTSVLSNISDLNMLGYFGRINYNYNQKYLLTVNARYDFASNLGKNNKWGFFPGISLGWSVDHEAFWKNNSKLANLLTLKLRASYGVNGNISGLTDFQAQGAFSPTSTRYGTSLGIQNTILENEDIQWERSKTLNGGLDLGLFKNRISILLDVYRRVTDNLLTSRELPASTGFANVFTNLGSLENKGIELELTGRVMRSDSPLQWAISFNASKTTHKVLELPPNGQENNRIGGIQVYDTNTKTYVYVPANNGKIEGQRIADWYAYHAIGVYATDADAANAPIDNVIGPNKVKKGGDVIWEDRDQNGLIDERDKVYMGTPFPTWTGGFSNNLSYKNFGLSVRMDFTTGHSIYNYGRSFMDGNWQGDVSPTQEFLDKSWKKQGDITNVPRYYPNEGTLMQNLWRANGNTGINSSYIEKGDFLCLREVSLSYNITGKLLQKAKIANLRLNVTGNNLHYFTKYRGLSPEDGGYNIDPNNQGDRGRYPMPRNFIFGANVSF